MNKKSDNTEILLEALTEDIAELKKSSGNSLDKDDVTEFKNLLNTKVDTLLSYGNDIDDVKSSLSILEVQVRSIGENANRTNGLFNNQCSEDPVEAERKLSQSNYWLVDQIVQVIWPPKRLIATILLFSIFSGLIFKYLHSQYYIPLHDGYQDRYHFLEWLTRDDPDYISAMNGKYLDNKEFFDAETDSLFNEEKKMNELLIQEKLVEIETLKQSY